MKRLARAGRPPRKDKPRPLNITLSERTHKALEKLTVFSPSKSYFIEQLIEAAAREVSK